MPLVRRSALPHSASFDSLSKPSAVVSAAAERGLTHLAITDHDRIDGALARARRRARRAARSSSARRCARRTGDLIALFLEKPIPPGLVAARGGAAHPRAGRPRRPGPSVRPFRAGAGRKGWETELERADSAARLRRDVERAPVGRRRQPAGRRVRHGARAAGRGGLGCPHGDGGRRRLHDPRRPLDYGRGPPRCAGAAHARHGRAARASSDWGCRWPSSSSACAAIAGWPAA